MDSEKQPIEKVKDRDVLDLTAGKLRLRADRLRKSARFTIVMIVAVLIGGIVIFITAGRIASNESQISYKKALLAEKKANLADKQKTVVHLEMQLRNLIMSYAARLQEKVGPEDRVLVPWLLKRKIR
jgi:hypothetical protein